MRFWHACRRPTRRRCSAHIWYARESVSSTTRFAHRGGSPSPSISMRSFHKTTHSASFDHFRHGAAAARTGIAVRVQVWRAAARIRVLRIRPASARAGRQALNEQQQLWNRAALSINKLKKLSIFIKSSCLPQNVIPHEPHRRPI
jgi:hypothetical protein